MDNFVRIWLQKAGRTVMFKEQTQSEATQRTESQSLPFEVTGYSECGNRKSFTYLCGRWTFSMGK